MLEWQVAETVTEPLHSIEAERSLVGAILIDPGLLQTLELAAGDFFIQRHGMIWRSFERLAKGGLAIDLLTVSEDLQRQDQLQEIGGLAYLSSMLQYVPTSVNAEDYARIVRDYARRRAWLQLANTIAKASYDTQTPLEKNAPAMLDQLLDSVRVSGAAGPLAPVVAKVYAELCARIESPADIWGIKTGFVDFDKITGGLQVGELLAIPGPPKLGKSTFAMQMGLQMAQMGTPGAIYSLEMPATQVVKRWASYLTKVISRKMKTGHIDGAEFELLSQALNNLPDLPLYISDSSDWNTIGLRADLARLKAQYDIQWFVLDYVYLMGDKRDASETEKTGFISAELKKICRAINVAGIAVNSLKKTGGKADMESVRGSFQQIYDADLSLFLSADEDQPNVIHCKFQAGGRELDEQRTGFDLIRLPGLPAVGNAETKKVNLGNWGNRKDIE